jgi:hypothetical protein
MLQLSFLVTSYVADLPTAFSAMNVAPDIWDCSFHYPDDFINQYRKLHLQYFGYTNSF